MDQAVVMAKPTGTTEAFLGHYRALAAELPGQDLPWLAELRRAGLARFAEQGLPGPREESWKYTNLRPLQRIDFAPEAEASVNVDRLPSLLPVGSAGHRLVFVNGCFRPDLSDTTDLPEGVQVGSLAEALARAPDELAEHLGRIANGAEQPLLALNTAMMRDGLVLRVPRGVAVAAPIEVILIGATPERPRAYHPRSLILLEPDSRATLIEHHVSLGGATTFANAVTEIEIGPGAVLNHYILQAEGTSAFQIATRHVRLAKGAHYDFFGLSVGGRLTRNEIAVRLEGAGAECHLNGAYLMRGRQHCDNTTTIEHLVPETSCREVFKGVLDDEARAVFQGRIVVHPGAQKSNGHQLSKALLLSDRAEIDTKPELEIYADDVLCSHGATAGALDGEALFYLRSRGIPEARARRMLIEAFLAEAINSIAAEGLCPALMSGVVAWLTTAGEE